MKQNINEIKRMQRIAGLITESEYQKSLMNEALTADELYKEFEEEDLLNDRREYDVEDLMLAYPGLSKKEAEKLEQMLQSGGDESTSTKSEEDSLPLTPKLQKFIDKVINDAKRDGEFEELVQVDYFENDLIDFILEKFDTEGNYGDVSQKVKDYIANAIK